MAAVLVGRVVELRRYPVKSMQGEQLVSAPVTWDGLAGDRRFSFVRSTNRGHFPWLTARELPELLRYRPILANPDDPARSALRITTPEGESLAVDDPALLERLASRAGEPLHLMHLGRGTYDSTALSILSTAALASLSAAAARELAAERFRANLLVEAIGAEPYPEDGWVGAGLRVGDGPEAPLLRVVRPIPRCAVITLDPQTTERTPAILRAVVQAHQANAGVYATVERGGRVAVGDGLFLDRSDEL